MLTRIIPVCDLREGIIEMFGGEIVSVIVASEGIEAPGAGEVQAVQMHQFSIRTINDFAGFKGEGAMVQSGEELSGPRFKFFIGEDLAHDVHFLQTGRQKIVAAGFPGDRAVLIFEVKTSCAFLNRGFKGVISHGHRIIIGETEAKGGVCVFAYPNGIDEFGEIVLVAL